MQERRRVIRRKMDYYFKIYDANAQQLVGHLSDISARGMLLDSMKPIEVGKTIQLKIEIISDALKTSDIEDLYSTPFNSGEGFMSNASIRHPKPSMILQNAAPI